MIKLNRIIPFIFLMILSQNVWSISASISHAIYQDVENGKSYIEVYTHIVGQSVVFSILDDNTNYQANIESTIVVKQGDEIINFKKYNLASPVTTTKIDFSDLTRMYLPEGDYTLKIELLDLNDGNNNFNSSNSISVTRETMSSLRLLSSAKPSVSDNAISKNGIAMEALAYNRYFDNQNTLVSYLELYPTNKETYSYVRYTINNSDSSILEKIKRYEDAPTIPCLIQFDISNLPSDQYSFHVELLNKQKDVISSDWMPFTRSNSILDIKLELSKNDNFATSFVHQINNNKLDYNLKSLMPIASSTERLILSNAIKNNEFSNKRYALFEYWQRSTNGVNTESAFNSYMMVAKAVDEKYYSGFGYGFESDRGHIFLKYGKPTNSVHIIDEPSAPPYEIWVYDYIEETNEPNVKFIFYSPSLSDDYLLLHSTCKYELSNKRWEHELYKKAPSQDIEGNSIDGGTVKANWNRKAKFYFENI